MPEEKIDQQPQVGDSDSDLSASVKISELPHRQSAEFQVIHSNSANMAETFWDAMIVFGQVMPFKGPDGPFIQDRIAITMSWEHMKALYKVLQRRVERYEKQHGPLRDPEKATESKDSPKG